MKTKILRGSTRVPLKNGALLILNADKTTVLLPTALKGGVRFLYPCAAFSR